MLAAAIVVALLADAAHGALHDAEAEAAAASEASLSTAAIDALTLDAFGSYRQLYLGSPVVDSITVLPGVPLGLVYNYYNLTLQAPTAGGFTIYSASYTGDVDLYVSDATIPWPTWTRGNYNWSCATDDAEYIYIDVATEAAACPNATYPCTFYIAVSPWLNQNSSYLLWALNSAAAMPLPDGLPINDHVYSNEQKHYTFNFTASIASPVLTLSVQATSGELWAGATLNSFGLPSWPTPAAPGDYSQLGSGVIVISALGPRFAAAGCVFGVPCPIAVTVYGLSESSYSIAASSGGGGGGSVPEVLEDGRPAFGFVPQGQYRYYSFTSTLTATPLLFIVTPGSGDPDLTVGTTPNPTMQNGSWISAGSGPEILTVPNFRNPGSQWWIGVYGWSNNATYSIVVVQQQPNYTIALVDGNPQVQATPAGHAFSYFTFNITRDGTMLSSVDFLAAPLSGDVDLYISTRPAAGSGGSTPVFPVPYCVTPAPGTPGGCSQWAVDPSTYTYSSAAAGVADFVTVPAAALVAGQQVIVGVLGTSPDTDSAVAPPSVFSVAAVSGNGRLQLPEGLPVVGLVDAAAFKYYSLTFSDYGYDLVFIGQATRGSMNVYVSESNPSPAPGANSWNSSGAGGFVTSRIVRVPFAALSPTCQGNLAAGATCTLYISVLGYGPAGGAQCAYTLAGSVSGSPAYPQTLVNGYAVQTYIPPGGFQYLTANVRINPSQSIYLVGQDLSGSSFMWVSIGLGKGFATAANGMAADYRSSDLGGYTRVVITPPGYTNPGTGDAEVDASLMSLRRHAPMPDGRDVLELRLPAPAAVTVVEEEEEAALPEDGRGRTFWQRYGVVADVDVSSSVPPEQRLGAGPYCSGSGGITCPLYVTIGAQSATLPSDVSVMYQAGSSYENLVDGQVTPGIVTPNATSTFAFAVADPLADVVFTVQQTINTVNVYIAVQSPLQPYAVPYAGFWQWIIEPWTGATRLNISHNDPNFCASNDGAVTAAPCTFLLAVSARNAGSTAYFNIAGTADSSASLVALIDGEGFDSVVRNGEYQYFSIQPGASGGPAVAPVLVVADVFEGQVQVYVTNLYTPGVSAASALPGAGSSVACQWTSADFPVLLLQAGDLCFTNNYQFYTIAVRGLTSASGGSPSHFSISATSNPSLARRLAYGVPITNVFIPDNINANFTFEIVDITQDVIITATPAYGEVSLMVSKHNLTAAPPSCWQFKSSTQIQCQGWTWQATGIAGATAIHIPAANPCAATSGTGLPLPFVNTSRCNSTFVPGRYWVAVYAWVDSEVSVAVQSVGQALELSDGQPQLALTTPMTLCPSRDPVSGACAGPISTWTYGVSSSFLTFVAPAAQSTSLQYVMLERLCPGGVDGYCGPNMHVYVRGCPAGLCAAEDAYPSFQLSDADVAVVDSVGALSFPSCYGGLPPPLGAKPCVYTVGVFPVCGSSPAVGMGCPSTLVRVTWAGDTGGLERISNDCFAAGRTCTLPAANVGTAINAVRRYEAYAGSLPTEVLVTVQACRGDVAAFGCYLTGSGCSPHTQPGPGNADWAIYTSTSTGRVASTDLTFAGLLFLGVGADPATAVSNPAYQLSLAAGRGYTLTLPAQPTPALARDTGAGTTATVSFEAPLLVAKGQQTYKPPGVLFTAFAFPTTSLDPSFNLGAVCGVTAANATVNPRAQYPTVTGTSTNGSPVITLAGLQPSVAYTVALVAACPAGSCMPAQLEGQSIAYLSAPLAPVPPPSPGPSPAPGPANAPAASNAGAVAGGVIGGLLGVAALGTAVWWFVVRPRYAAGAGGYSAFTQKSGGSGAGWFTSSSNDGDSRLVDRYSSGRQGGRDAVDAGSGGGEAYSML